MVQPFIILVAALPLIFRLVPWFVPAAYLESYHYWSADALNLRPGEGVASTKWRNMGYWKDTELFPEAAEALARKLVDFADAPRGGAVLDVAHGSGESLIVHLQASPPPSHLYGLTSLLSETEHARRLLDKTPHSNTSVELFTSSASYRPGKDVGHVLDPMKGYLGKRTAIDEDDDIDHVEEEGRPIATPPPYDLVYILDAIYHFPPAVPHFLASVIKVLRPGSGVIAYTDILPPPGVSSLLGNLILPPLLSVPARNLMSRPKDLGQYKTLLTDIGYENIAIEDWSEDVWKGFASNLRQRGFGWRQVARLIEAADRGGWKFIAVRAKRSAQLMYDE